MTKIIDDVDGLCSLCKKRFRRVFKTTHIYDYIDDEAEKIDDGDSVGHVVVNICLVSENPLLDEETTECSHFDPIEDDDLT